MSDNELTISDYYEEYPIMRYMLPGLVYNSGGAPQMNISNNAFILRQGAWVLSKILDDEHTEYGYETFHPAQRYVTAGGAVNTVSVDRNKRNAMMASLNSIAFSMQGVGASIANIAVPNANMAVGAGNAYTGPAPGIIACALHPYGANIHAGALWNYITACHAIIDNNVTLDNGIYARIEDYINRTFTDVAGAANAFHTALNVNPLAGHGNFNPAQINNIITHLCGGVPGNASAGTIEYYNTLKLTLPEPCDLPFYIIKSLISRIINSLGLYQGRNANYDGMNAVQIVEQCILSRQFIQFLANLATTGIAGNRNHRKTSFFHHLTATAPHLNRPIGLHTNLDGGSYIVPYTDYEERSQSTGGNTIDNRDLLNGVPAGAEPRMHQVGDRIRNGRKGDHIATVLTPDDVRLLAIFLQLAEEHFNAAAAKTLYSSRDDITYRDRTDGIRTPGTIASYFDHLIALRKTDHTVRKGSGLNQGKVEALSVLAGLRYAIQGPIFPVLSETVFHLVAHYFVRLVVHDSRGMAAANLNFHNNDIYNDTAGIQHYMRFLGGNGKGLQLKDTLNDQVVIPRPPAIFGYNTGHPGYVAANSPLVVYNNGTYDYNEQVLNFIQLIQSFIAPGTIDAVNPVSTTFARNDVGNVGRLLANSGHPDSMETTCDIIRTVYNDIRAFVTGTQFNYATVQNDFPGPPAGPEEVFYGFTGSLDFEGYTQLNNINATNVEPTLFDVDVRHLLKYNITDRAIRVIGTTVCLMGTSTQNSYLGAEFGPKQKLDNTAFFMINAQGRPEYHQIINGQDTITDTTKYYNDIIGNNDFCKVFGSAKFDPAHNRTCSTMVHVCSLFGDGADPKKCIEAFKGIADGQVSKNLRGWNSQDKNLTKINIYNILKGMGIHPRRDKDGNLTFMDENGNHIMSDQEIFDHLELQNTGVTSNNSYHVKYIKKLMETHNVMVLAKQPTEKNKSNLPTLILDDDDDDTRPQVVRGVLVGLRSGMTGGNNNHQLSIMYGGTDYDINIIRRKITELKERAKKMGISMSQKDETKLNKIIETLGKDFKEMYNLTLKLETRIDFKSRLQRNPTAHELNEELKKRIDFLKQKTDKALGKINEVGRVLTNNMYLLSVTN